MNFRDYCDQALNRIQAKFPSLTFTKDSLDIDELYSIAIGDPTLEEAEVQIYPAMYDEGFVEGVENFDPSDVLESPLAIHKILLHAAAMTAISHVGKINGIKLDV